MKIGIIGGGQLGLMMAEAALELGHEVIGLDPNETCPLSKVAPIIVSHYNDHSAFEKLATACDVLTYEFENVDLDLVHKYEHLIPQKAKALELSRHRLLEKQFAASCDILIPEVSRFDSIESIKIPCIIKTTTGGYDGKGQFVIKDESDINHFHPNDQLEYIVESFIPFDYEISCIITRDKFGNCEVQPIPINIHKKGILFLSDVTSNIPIHIEKQTITHSKKLIEKLDYVGTLAIEYFVLKDTVIFNEFAPRPHNSGHYSIEGSTTSQYKNHILAITGYRAEKASLKHPTVMLNLLGHSISIIDRFKLLDNVYFHEYHKSEIKVDRKMGHVTITDKNLIALKKSLLQILEAIK